MKTKNQLFTACIIFIQALLACNGGNEKTSQPNKVKIPVEVVLKNSYKLVTGESKADWNRTLDQKATKQKVKIFGQMVDVELGEVKLNTNGNVDLIDGVLITSNNKITEATVIFDMATFKLAKEKGNGLFDIESYPNSTLEITGFLEDSTGYQSKGALTIQEVTNMIDIHLSINKSDNSQILTGSFMFNTLDFPLRDQVKAKDVKKDEIEIKLELNYLLND